MAPLIPPSKRRPGAGVSGDQVLLFAIGCVAAAALIAIILLVTGESLHESLGCKNPGCIGAYGPLGGYSSDAQQ